MEHLINNPEWEPVLELLASKQKPNIELAKQLILGNRLFSETLFRLEHQYHIYNFPLEHYEREVLFGYNPSSTHSLLLDEHVYIYKNTGAFELIQNNRAFFSKLFCNADLYIKCSNFLQFPFLLWFGSELKDNTLYLFNGNTQARVENTGKNRGAWDGLVKKAYPVLELLDLSLGKPREAYEYLRCLCSASPYSEIYRQVKQIPGYYMPSRESLRVNGCLFTGSCFVDFLGYTEYNKENF